MACQRVISTHIQLTNYSLQLSGVCAKSSLTYLYGTNFVGVTDKCSFIYLLTTERLDAASHRWIAALSTYTF